MIMALAAQAEHALNSTQISDCAKPCLTAYCALTDLACLCDNGESQADSCILSKCSINQALATRVFIETACQTPVRDRARTFNVMIFVVGGFTAFFVFTRLIYKQFFSPKKRLEMQDWPIAIAVPFGVTAIGITVGGLTAHGLGKDIWGVPTSDLRSFGYYFWTIEILYIILIIIIKLSLCFFYLQIFMGRTTRIVVWVTAGLHVATMISFVVAIILQCRPMSSQWDRYDFSEANDSRKTTKCVNVNTAGWVQAALNVASDLWLLAIPLYHVTKLDLHWKKKIGVVLMFGTGACVTVVSFLRLRSLIRYAHTTNPTWDQWDLVFWSAIELLVAFICTSLPTMRLILVRMLPRIFGTTHTASDDRHELSPSRSPSCATAPFDFHDASLGLDRSKSANGDSLVVDEQRYEIRTQPLGDEPGFKRLSPKEVHCKGDSPTGKCWSSL